MSEHIPTFLIALGVAAVLCLLTTCSIDENRVSRAYREQCRTDGGGVVHLTSSDVCLKNGVLISSR